MAHFAIVCPPTPGHVNPFAALGRSLQRRGHRVTLFQIPPLRETARREGLDFHPVGDTEGREMAEAIASLVELKGFASVRFAIECSRRISDLLCRELPGALRRAGVDFVLADQNEPAAASVAESLRLPFISVCPGLPLNREPAIPPPFFGWAWCDSVLARARNRAGMAIADRLIAPVNHTLNQYRTRWGLAPIRTPDDSFSPLAQLCQLTPEFDFPRRNLPRGFHYLGPFVDGEGVKYSFPWEQLNGKPLVYASLGTLQDPGVEYFRTIARACAGMNVQLVIAAGGNRADALSNLEGAAVVVPHAPQLELLARAALTITHAGLNTVMQSLLFGVPMVAIPLAHDQPATAARVARSGTGEVIPLRAVNVGRLRAAIARVLEQPRFRQNAAGIRESIKGAGGVEKGSDVIEGALNVRVRRASA